MMDLGLLISIARASLIQILLISGPILIVAVVVGLIISIGQAVTSIQEQTLTFVPKIILILLTLYVLGPWMVNQIINFTVSIWRQMIYF